MIILIAINPMYQYFILIACKARQLLERWWKLFKTNQFGVLLKKVFNEN